MLIGHTLCGGNWEGEESGKLKLMEGWELPTDGGEAPQYLHFLLCSTGENGSDLNLLAPNYFIF